VVIRCYGHAAVFGEIIVNGVRPSRRAAGGSGFRAATGTQGVGSQPRARSGNDWRPTRTLRERDSAMSRPISRGRRAAGDSRTKEL
jgi:hypothetical protein